MRKNREQGLKLNPSKASKTETQCTAKRVDFKSLGFLVLIIFKKMWRLHVITDAPRLVPHLLIRKVFYSFNPFFLSASSNGFLNSRRSSVFQRCKVQWRRRDQTHRRGRDQNFQKGTCYVHFIPSKLALSHCGLAEIILKRKILLYMLFLDMLHFNYWGGCFPVGRAADS